MVVNDFQEKHVNLKNRQGPGIGFLLAGRGGDKLQKGNEQGCTKAALLCKCLPDKSLGAALRRIGENMTLSWLFDEIPVGENLR